jgi:uncharacterized protein (TIGR00251 family)
LTARLSLKVVPSASRTQISGWLGATLKVKVTAPPEKGKANAAVEQLIAATLGLPPGSARIVSGSGSPLKVVQIQGLSLDEILQRLEAPAV